LLPLLKTKSGYDDRNHNQNVGKRNKKRRTASLFDNPHRPFQAVAEELVAQARAAFEDEAQQQQVARVRLSLRTN
jgi:thymidine kinase